MIKFDRAIGGYYGADNVFGKVSLLDFLENRIVLEIRDKTKEDAVSIETTFEGMDFFTFQVGFIGNEIVYEGDVILSPNNERYHTHRGLDDTILLERLDDDLESISDGDDGNYNQEDFSIHFSDYKVLGNIIRLKVQKEKDANRENMDFDMEIFKANSIFDEPIYYYVGNDRERNEMHLIHASFVGTEILSNFNGYIITRFSTNEFIEKVENGMFTKVSKEEFENYRIAMRAN